MKYETVIGLEVHLQLATRSKAFCGCSTKFGSPPNSQTCPVCLGLPGSLPVLNAEAFGFAMKVALGLNCTVQKTVKFDRKNYYYPDLPKNFQISQYDMPLAYDGFLGRIRIKRVHLEEDAGKLIHPEGAGHSLIDYNRSGIPLLEIVTEPDIKSSEEAYDYLTALKIAIAYLKVSDCDMEKGSLRCDANISLRPEGQAGLGTKVEIKNMNSFKNVKAALDYEVKRQSFLLAEGGRVTQETRLWDAERELTTQMRTKEGAEDYRYFPEPDLVPFVVDESVVEKAKSGLPEPRQNREKRFVSEFGLPEYDAKVLTSDIDMADYFERVARSSSNRKAIANWITGDIMAHLNEKGLSIKDLGVSADGLAGLIGLIDSGAISGKMAKDVLREAIETGLDPAAIVKKSGLSQVSDSAEIEKAVNRVLACETKSVNDYKSGKKNALGHLVGQVMKEMKGKANPAMVNDILKKVLGG